MLNTIKEDNYDVNNNTNIMAQEVIAYCRGDKYSSITNKKGSVLEMEGETMDHA